MSLPSASAQNRIAACAASGAGEQVERVTGDATAGVWKHRYSEVWLKDGDVSAALAAVPEEYRQGCERIAYALEQLPFKPGEVGTEVAFAYDVLLDEAREIGRGIDRGYEKDGPLAETEIPGTFDVVAIAADRSFAWVRDFKFGFHSVPPAARNRQLHVGALAVSRAYGIPRVFVAIDYISEDEEPRSDVAEFGPDALDELAVDLAETNALVRLERDAYDAGLSPRKVIAGPHCHSAGSPCPRLQSCTATTGLLRSAVLHPELLEMRGLTPAQKADAKVKLDVLGALIKRAWDELDAQAAADPFPLGNGKWYGPVRTESERLDGDIAYRVLADTLGADVANGAAKKTVTKKALTDALRAVAPKGKLADLERKALAAIDEAGGINRKVGVSIKEHTRRPELVAAKSEAA